MPVNKIICGAMPEATKGLPDGSINCCISSPPYWALRDYGVDGQLGLEKTFEEYIDKLCTIYDEVKRVLRDDGTCWVNLGDTYSAKGTGKGQSNQLANKGDKCDSFRSAKYLNQDKIDTTNLAPEKSLCLIPQRFAIEMCRQRGKYVKSRDNQIWLAALVDGEGCIAIHRRAKGRKNPTYGATLSVYNTCKELIDKAQAVCGGIGSRRKKTNDTHRNAPVYEWRVMSNNAKDVLRDIYPYLIAKKYQARAAIFCPSNGKDAEESWLNVKAKNSFRDITRKYPEPRLGSTDPWILRNTIIWKKPNPMPSSAKDRFTVDFEYVYFFVKSKKYWFEPQYEPADSPPGHKWNLNTPKTFGGDGHIGKNTQNKNRAIWELNPLGRNKRTVWTIPTQPLSSAVSYGSYRITSPDCPKHGCQACRFPFRQYDESQGVCQLLRNLGIDICRDSKQLNVVSAKSSNLSEFPLSEFSAIVRNIQTRKKEVWSKLNEICDDKSAFHILCKEQNHRFGAKSGHKYGNSILVDAVTDGTELCPLAQILFHNASISTFQDSLINCQCNYIGKIEKRQDHFASFPEKLVEPMIKAGCPEFVCTKCGKAREKIWDTEYVYPDELPKNNPNYGSRRKAKNWANRFDNNTKEESFEVKYKQTRPIGYTDCGCNADWRPGIVLDCFCRQLYHWSGCRKVA